MDYNNAIERVYQHVEHGKIDSAVMGCLRIARHLKDYFQAAIFLRELYPDKKQLVHALYDDTSHLKEEARNYLYEQSLERWLEVHTLDFDLGGTNEKGEKRNVLALSVSELDPELEQLELAIQDLAIPSGMGEFDTAAFTDRYNNEKTWRRLRIKAIHVLKSRIKILCLNYAIRIERQLNAERKSRNFLEEVQSTVNNYFKAHNEDVYAKLQSAAQLVDSDSPEDLSLLLTQVRRATKAAADHFYPPSHQPIKCSDGVERILDDEKYLNRLQEFLAIRVAKSSSGDLLRAEFNYLMTFLRRLNDVASKGVHGTVSFSEAKQGLVGLYFFLSNLCSLIDEEELA